MVPPDPQASPAAAASALIADWENAERAGAATVATPSAVRSLFAMAYAGQVLNDRGCGVPGPNPVICTWGPYALASPTDALYELTTRPVGSAWYVARVKKEG